MASWEPTPLSPIKKPLVRMLEPTRCSAARWPNCAWRRSRPFIKLNETSKVGTFAKSMAATAVQPLESAGNMVMHPVDTVTGLPSGVGRFFDRVGSGVGRLVDSEPSPAAAEKRREP